MLFLLLIYSCFNVCDTLVSNQTAMITSAQTFPHNIDKDFVLNISHSEIEYHPINAVMILQVDCRLIYEIQRFYIYPGFTEKLDHRLKDRLFHIMHFATYRFFTVVIVRFFRESHDCSFTVEYSSSGAEKIHIKDPIDAFQIFQAKIALYRPPMLHLSVLADDGHNTGLSIGRPAVITCRVTDGFPLFAPTLKIDRKIAVLSGPTIFGDKVSMKVAADVSNHGSVVTCASGDTVTETKMRVFHHASFLQILPDHQSRFPRGSKIECRSRGGYPTPRVSWTVHNLNDTTRRYFSISSIKSVSTIYIRAFIPNETDWMLNCSSINVIPPLDRGGPSIALNITIGENSFAYLLMAKYSWVAIVLVIILVFIVIVLAICITRNIKLRKLRKNYSSDQKDPKDLLRFQSIDRNDMDDKRDPLNKEVDMFV